MNWAVIMAGGYGERFWPVSRRNRPKQLLPIVGRKTMLQQTVERLLPVVPATRILVVTQREQAAQVRQQVPRVKYVVAEPAAKNTAPCVGLAAAIVGKHDPDAVMAVVPSDSYIGNVPRYRQVVGEALALAGEQDVLVTIGIQPTAPRTGYGYIQVGEPLRAGFWQARRFVEKPDRATAEQFLAGGDYRWNAGMFVWSARAINAAFAQHQPTLAAAFARIGAAVNTEAFTRVVAREFRAMPKISVDYAIMEKAGNVVMANGDFDWDDVGDWAAVERHRPAQPANFVSVDSSGCVVVAGRGHTVAAVGVNDLVIVHTSDATLVCRKQDAQKVRDLVKKLAGDRKHKRLL
jgi:mannose-1-phosphate guanylyltransferase